MDHNPLSYDGRQPIANMGVVAGKVMLDKALVEERMANAQDPDTITSCIPGGAQPENHALLWGDPLFGMKCVRNGAAGEGEPNELVTSSLAGVNIYDYGSTDALEEDYYFAGFAVDNYYLADPNGGSIVPSPESGIATVRVGTQSTRNNGPYEFYPGQRICFRAPKTMRANSHSGVVMEDGGMPLAKRARSGEPNTRVRFELVPFDYTDFTTQVSGAYALIQTSHQDRNAGISDLPFSHFEQRDERTGLHVLSGRLEAAGGRKFGDFGFALAVIETLAENGFLTIDYADISIAEKVRRLAVDMGLWSTDVSKQTILLDAYRNAYFQDLPMDSRVIAVRTNFVSNHVTAIGSTVPQVMARDNRVANNTDIAFAKLRLQLSRFKDGALVADWNSKQSKVIATALNNAGPTQTLHCLAGHSPL